MSRKSVCLLKGQIVAKGSKFFNLKFNFYLRSLNFGPFQRHTDEFETYICRDGTKRDYEIKIYEWKIYQFFLKIRSFVYLKNFS